jgi:hypothetical protein
MNRLDGKQPARWGKSLIHGSERCSLPFDHAKTVESQDPTWVL